MELATMKVRLLTSTLRSGGKPKTRLRSIPGPPEPQKETDKCKGQPGNASKETHPNPHRTNGVLHAATSLHVQRSARSGVTTYQGEPNDPAVVCGVAPLLANATHSQT